LNLPFLFSTQEQFHTMIDGQVGDALNAKIRDEAGIEVLYWSTVGFLFTFFSGPELINSPSGFRNKAVRVAQSPIFINALNALGAQAIDMPLGEVYTAMQTGALDGYVLPYWAARDT
jgi:TRAP-type C4-dicarboxylate transport system substrate-binding protein